ncbi:MAG: stage II sporulation protein M [Candidatus Aenigmarchaeota archaeon]|nr:stage II sporulation protein M [Candidatus Aenigmarchaeota archaeon]
MLEGLWLREEYRNKPLYIFIFGLVFTILASVISKFVFPSFTGIISVFLVSLMGAYPLITYLRKKESQEMMKRMSEEKLLRRHEDELMIYLSFFLGVTIGYIISACLLPANYFQIQEEVILSIRGSITGDLLNTSFLHAIISNNLWVFFLTFAISFLFSAGMIFILVWNASVLGVFLAKASENIMHFHLLAISYLPHGLLEITSYILAGISGALISYQFDYYFVRKEKYDLEPVLRAVKDSLVLITIGLFCLFLAGVIEVM